MIVEVSETPTRESHEDPVTDTKLLGVSLESASIISPATKGTGNPDSNELRRGNMWLLSLPGVCLCGRKAESYRPRSKSRMGNESGIWKARG